ncbi:condensation domain-containing protein [Streptomyces sp. NPDC047971]|uniref:condensation domain-containing protein n=1 Tax=Streptomyces sp. NPDC047971 TaxID=3154499 RepID=UPI0033E524EA
MHTTTTARRPLSDMQLSMLAHEALEELPIYTMPLCFALTGPVDTTALARALHHVVRRHPALGSLYDGGEAEPLGGATAPPELLLTTTEAAPGTVPPEAATVWETPFALHEQTPVRAALVSAAPDRHHLALAVHHVAGDSVALSLLLRDLGAAYAALLRGERPDDTPAPDFFDHARRERNRSWDTSWWQERLRGVRPRPYPRRQPPPEAERCTRVSVDLALDATDTRGVKELARRLRVTPSAVLLAAVGRTVADTAPGAERESVIGLPTALRDTPELRSTVGPLLNTLPVRTRWDADAAPGDVVRAHAAALDASLAHKEVPYSHIVKASGAPRSLDAAPLFLHVVNIDSEPLRLRLPGARCGHVPVPRRWVVFPAHWEFGCPPVGNLRGELRVSADAFTASQAAGLATAFRSSLTELLQAP